MNARPMTALFFLVCAGGSVAAATLVVHEARSTDPLVAEVRSSTRSGLSTRVTVEVRNTTGEARCGVLRVVARDRAGRDLASVDVGSVELPPHGRAPAQGTLVLTARQYAERLSITRAVISPCR